MRNKVLPSTLRCLMVLMFLWSTKSASLRASYLPYCEGGLNWSCSYNGSCLGAQQCDGEGHFCDCQWDQYESYSYAASGGYQMDSCDQRGNPPGCTDSTGLYDCNIRTGISGCCGTNGSYCVDGDGCCNGYECVGNACTPSCPYTDWCGDQGCACWSVGDCTAFKESGECTDVTSDCPGYCNQL